MWDNRKNTDFSNWKGFAAVATVSFQPLVPDFFPASPPAIHVHRSLTQHSHFNDTFSVPFPMYRREVLHSTTKSSSRRNRFGGCKIDSYKFIPSCGIQSHVDSVHTIFTSRRGAVRSTGIPTTINKTKKKKLENDSTSFLSHSSAIIND